MSANPSVAGSIELLDKSQFPGDWVAVGPVGAWELNAAGELIQVVPVRPCWRPGIAFVDPCVRVERRILHVPDSAS